MSGPEDRYSEQEMARILKATSASGAHLPVSGRTAGFSVEEIESIAREAGLDPGGIAAAAAQVSIDRSRGILGDTGMIDLSRRVPGVVSSRDYGRLADAISEMAGESGVRSSTFGALTWESPRGASRMQVTVTPEEDSTSIRVHADASALKGLCYVASTAGALALGGITGAITEPTAVLAGVGIMVGAAAAGLSTGWVFWKVQGRRLRQRVSSVFAVVSDRAADLAAGDVEPGGSVPGPGQESR